PQLSKSSRESCNKSKPPGIVTTASALQRRLPRMPTSSKSLGTVGRAGCHRGGAPAHLRDDLQSSHASFVQRSIRFLRPDVAVVFARAHVKFKEGNEAREIETRPTLIVVKEQDKWQIVAFQNTKISEVPAAAQAAARLAT